MLLSTALLGGMALGGLGVLGKNLLFSKDKVEESQIDKISSDEWEKLWFYNKVCITVDKDDIRTPFLLGVCKLGDNGARYLFRVPYGVTSDSMKRVSSEIKEKFNVDDVAIKPYKDDMVAVELRNVEPENIFKGSIPNEKWEELWKELKIYTGESSVGYKFPTLISENKVAGGIVYEFQLPIGKSSFHVDKQDITVSEFLEARYVEITPTTKNRIEIKAIYDELPTIIPFELVPRTSKDSFEVFIGKFMDDYSRLDFRAMANVLDAGMQGSGKSVVTKACLTYIGCMYDPSEIEVYIADLKRTELGRFRNMKQVKKYVETPEQTNEMVKELLDIMDERYKLFAQRGVSDAYEFNKKYPNEKMPYIFVVIEEMSRYTSNTSLKNLCKSNKEDDQNEKLAELLFNGRASALTVWVTVQRPTKDNLSPDVKSSMGNILAFKTMNSLNSRIICDSDDKLKYLRGKGHGYLISEEGEREMQTFWISNDDIERLLKQHNAFRDTNDVLQLN